VKVLVIDPDLTRAPALRQALLAGGAEVTLASSGSFALTLLERNRHDVVVSQARIDDMDGPELCAILKADPSTRDVRFVLVAGPDVVTAAATAAAGVDLVLPPGMTDGAILPLVLRLMRADRAPVPPPAPPAVVIEPAPGPSAAPGASAPGGVEPEVASPAGVPRIRPEPPAPPSAAPPRRYATAGASAAAAPWSKSTLEDAALPAVSPSAAPVRVVKALAPPTPTPVSAPAPPRATSAAVGPAQLEELMAMPSGTFQGSLEVMELADLTQAIAAGGKSGRLILALSQGGGLLLFDKGRVVHAEYRNTVGEEAFGALLAACHGDGAGRFCFLPTPTGAAAKMPRTIDKTIDRLLLSSATAIDEKG
jgi:CheY-like chemotaxis protein